MSSIVITLPDGSQKSLPTGSRPLDAALAISPRLADDAIAAKVNGEMADLTRPLDADVHLQILTPRDPESLEVYRHSTAHLLAAAVLELWPDTQLGIGPPIENGFYYDFDKTVPFTADDLEKIEAKMWEIQARNLTYDRIMTEKGEGLKKYAHLWMKSELIAERAGEVFSEYTLGPQFIDFCRGPHLPSTKKIKAFKLLHLAGAYWKGDEHNKQLQRIYGTAFFTKKELDEFIAKLHAFRAEYGREKEPFEIQNMGASAYSPDGIKRLEDRGVAEVIVAFRDVYKKQPDPSLEEKLATMRWYADNVIAKSR